MFDAAAGLLPHNYRAIVNLEVLKVGLVEFVRSYKCDWVGNGEIMSRDSRCEVDGDVGDHVRGVVFIWWKWYFSVCCDVKGELERIW